MGCPVYAPPDGCRLQKKKHDNIEDYSDCHAHSRRIFEGLRSVNIVCSTSIGHSRSTEPAVMVFKAAMNYRCAHADCRLLAHAWAVITCCNWVPVLRSLTRCRGCLWFDRHDVFSPSHKTELEQMVRGSKVLKVRCRLWAQV